MRFYPESIKPFTNEPTKDRFYIRDISPSVGQGVATLTTFRPGELVFAFSGRLSKTITQYTLQIEPGLHLEDPYFMGKVLHSCDPNTSCDMRTRTFRALRYIFPGDLITMDYAETEDTLFRSFPCSCLSANCRGYVTGKKEQLPAGLERQFNQRNSATHLL